MKFEYTLEEGQLSFLLHQDKGQIKEKICSSTKLFEDFLLKLKAVNGKIEGEINKVNKQITIKIDDILISSTIENIQSAILDKIINFKNGLLRGDKLVKISNYTSKGLVAVINLENSNKLKEINVSNYSSFCKVREKFYNSIKDSGFDIMDYVYSDKNDMITVHIDDVSFKTSPNNILCHVIKGQAKFKDDLKKNGDKFVKFSRKSGVNWVATILLEGKEEYLINANIYNKFSTGRTDFYNFVKSIGAEVVDSVYKGSGKSLNIKIDNAVLSITPTSFIRQTAQTILRFKKKLEANGDKFIRFSGKTKKGVLIATLELKGGEVKDIDVANYDSFCSSRAYFEEIIDELNGEIIGSYKGLEDIVKIKIDDVIIEQVGYNIKNDTYHSIKRFKKRCIQNGDTFVKFTGLNNRNTLNAKIMPFDSVNNECLEINLNSYHKLITSRKKFYNSVNSVGGTVLGMYKSNTDAVDIQLDDLILSSVVPDSFKLQIQKSILTFKKQLSKNGDIFVKFIGRTATSLIAKVLLEGVEETEIFINSYNNFCQGRKRFYKFKKENDRFTIYGVYKGSVSKLRVKCNLDGYEFDFSPSLLQSRIRCPRCSESKGEAKISEWLDTHNVKYIKEKTFEDLRDKSLLRYDFYMIYNNYEICIEYDGEQHYTCVNFTGSIPPEQLEKNLKSAQYRDMLKSEYCKHKGITLLRIPYWDYNNIETILAKFFKNIDT